jgi:hypothetical protein
MLASEIKTLENRRLFRFIDEYLTSSCGPAQKACAVVAIAIFPKQKIAAPYRENSTSPRPASPSSPAISGMALLPSALFWERSSEPYHDRMLLLFTLGIGSWKSFNWSTKVPPRMMVAWPTIGTDEKRRVVESIVEKIVVDNDAKEIEITLSCIPTSEETTNSQQAL